jgi:hypothetical protein
MICVGADLNKKMGCRFLNGDVMMHRLIERCIMGSFKNPIIFIDIKCFGDSDRILKIGMLKCNNKKKQMMFRYNFSNM